MNKSATSLSLVAALGFALLAPTTLPASAASKVAPKPATAAQSSTPPVSSSVISSDASAVKGTLVVSSKSGVRGGSFKVYKTSLKSSAVQITIKSPKKSRLLFTVIRAEGDSFYVNLPSRPNGSKGYVRKADVTAGFENPYRILISLTDKRMSAYKGDILIRSTKIAIGAAATPTPTGEFYTYWTRRPKVGQRGYGVFIIGLSGFSDVFKKYGAGDGRIGLHGTYDEAVLGSPASAGCVRMSNADITFLKETIFPGTPVVITP